ncbi:DEAD/DEAH box helicase family protein [Corallococcus sp. ZKHCc1 1396]|uniref:DEAD/DEAH box helicase family protein n=1 Tax=Corallococcus soli TaxID=2710757 RepID=A0ABR9PXR9_9BACT|nr:SNF2-related protein [Corallococcus soli]MBE4752726.1 DEAD/DEAH box helicase family protein [Corallococcus soli]
MMDDFQIDARRWRFLDNPARYIERETGGLQVEPLARQFKTAKEILSRLVGGRGVLLADDVGLGKTTVGALVAWVVACQDKRVRIYAPNEVLRRRWAEELERHVPLLEQLGASYDRIKQGDVGKLNAGRIQIATHHALVKSHGNNEQRTACDLMIIDEAHRAKGDGSAFNEALRNLGDHAKRKLILTATPFSIRLAELEQLLQFAGATELEAVRRYAGELKRLYTLGDGHDATAESKRLVSAARAAIEELQPYLIRHGVDDLSASERKHFGAVSAGRWEIPTAPATQEDLALLLRMDRLLQLTPERKGERRNDPRFHIGWQHVGTKLERATERAKDDSDHAALRHIKAATKALSVRRTKPHPKIAAVSEAIRPLLDAGEKVLVFCHHRATASELLGALERSLKAASDSRSGPPEKVWRAAWESLLPSKDALVAPIIDWLSTPGLRWQIGGWLGKPASTAKALADQFATIRPRNVPSGVPTILEAATTLTESLLDTQSTSTRALLKSIVKGTHTFGGKASRFPGRLNDGLRAMGAWDHDGHGEPPKTLYTGKPDIVLALFNSPFGPDVLVTTDRLSEGVDLHRCCRYLIHYELDPSPVRTLQRNGRVRRVGSWAALTGQPICYAYPTFGGTRDEKAVGIMRQRINAFGLLLGGVPSLDDEAGYSEQSFVEAVLRGARKDLELLNRRLCV